MEFLLETKSGLGLEDDDGDGACFAVSDDPVSIWTTCLKVEVFAWTKVVG